MNKNFLPLLYAEFFQNISNFPNIAWLSNKIPDLPWIPLPSESPEIFSVLNS